MIVSSVNPPVIAAAPDVRRTGVPLSVFIGWGQASLVISILTNTVNTVLLRYLTDMVGLSSAFAGAAVAGAAIAAAMAHPIVGTLSDRTHTRFGRRRPYILGGGVVCALAILGVFNLHRIESLPWATVLTVVALLAFGIGLALVVIPTIAMSAEITDDVDERMRLVSVRVYLMAIGGFVGSSVAPVLLSAGGVPATGYSLLAWSVSAATITGCLICFAMTGRARATKATTHKTMSLIQRLRMVAGNRPFMVLIGIKVIFWTGVAINNGMLAYFTRYVLQVSDTWFGIYNGVKIAGWIGALQLWMWLAARKGKRFAFATAVVLYALVYVSWLAAGPEVSSAGIVVRALLIGVALGGVGLNVQAMLPDAIQYDHHLTGLRREGVYSGIYSLIETAALSGGMMMIGILLASGGYVSGTGGATTVQPAGAVAMIHYAYALTPLVCSVLALAGLRFYGLDREQMIAITEAARLAEAGETPARH